MDMNKHKFSLLLVVLVPWLGEAQRRRLVLENREKHELHEIQTRRALTLISRTLHCSPHMQIITIVGVNESVSGIVVLIFVERAVGLSACSESQARLNAKVGRELR